ncbi:MAG TPA: alpha/beta hydrolase [Terracidiphilus sp.]|jgi:acetyl esterase/lipase|nr:alpha/beta hydrolase [Terracidiphilus sp.]
MKTSALVLCATLTATTLSAIAQTPAWQPAPGHITLPLWPNGAPGASSDAPPERDMTKPTDNLIAGRPLIRLGKVSSPTMTYYAPKSAIQSPAPAVVVFPGGGYTILAIDLEGTEVCDWLNNIGVACLLVKYRVPNTGPYPKSPAALQDAQRALGMARQHAKEWNIDPGKIGVLGFSAGAHLSAALSTHFDKRLYDRIDAADDQSCRPDFAFIIYPGYLALAEQNMSTNPEIKPTAQTPPSFIVQAEDDPVHVENATNYFLQLKAAKVPAELHIYAEGGHGYGLRETKLPVTHWTRLAQIWLESIKVLPESTK